MNGATAMGSRGFHVVANGERRTSDDPQWIRDVNEKIAIIQGLTELLVDPNGLLDDSTAKAALESINRHAAGLRDLIKQF